MKRAICLSGGGGKGAYQIGVWKALKRLHIKYDIVTGTSVGALNGALMAQKEYYKGIILWKKMNFNLIFDNSLQKNYTYLDVLKMYGKNMVLHGGMNVQKLENLVVNCLNEQKLINSNIDLGIVTFNLTTLKPQIIKKKEVDPQLLKDYLIASATCFPAFKTKKINNSNYIDGGYYDNLPINLAIDMGATEVIAVDLDAIGRKRTIKNENINITYIQPNNDLGSFLIFDKELALKNMKYGYNDTMKIYHKLEGKNFTFKNGTLLKLYQKYGDRSYKIFDESLTNTNTKTSFTLEILTISLYRKFINAKTREKTFIESINHLAKTLEIDATLIYNYSSFKKSILCKANNYKKDTDIEKMIKNGNLKKLLNTSNIILYMEKELEQKEDKDLAQLAIIFPKEFLDAIILYSLKGN